jgi:hypothetical protein
MLFMIAKVRWLGQVFLDSRLKLVSLYILAFHNISKTVTSFSSLSVRMCDSMASSGQRCYWKFVHIISNPEWLFLDLIWTRLVHYLSECSTIGIVGTEWGMLHGYGWNHPVCSDLWHNILNSLDLLLVDGVKLVPVLASSDIVIRSPVNRDRQFE